MSSSLALVPNRHPNYDLFVCDVADAVLKDIMPQMEHPFYSLSKKPEMKPRRYEHNDCWLEVTPSYKGLATIYDKDILIYCISQIMAAMKQGEPVSQRVRINSRELLMFTNRGTSGRDYVALSDALDRLGGTRIITNVKTGDEEQRDNFGLIDASSIRRKNGLEGRLLWCEIKLSDWVFNAICAKEVLSLHPDYFRLRKPLERRIYEIARKHCGRQGKWAISLEKLLQKTGSASTLRRFRHNMRLLVKSNHLPDYSLTLEGDVVTFYNRQTMPEKRGAGKLAAIHLRPDTYEKAKRAAPGYDVYALEEDWRIWQSGKGTPKNADAAFIGFCKNRYAKNPNP